MNGYGNGYGSGYGGSGYGNGYTGGYGNNYSNPNVNGLPGTTSVWVGSSANLAMRPLVDQFGNLNFNNQLIPLTTPVTPFVNPSPSLPNLSPATTISPVSPTMPLNSPFAPPPQQTTGQYYVVSVHESPTKDIQNPLTSGAVSRNVTSREYDIDARPRQRQVDPGVERPILPPGPVRQRSGDETDGGQQVIPPPPPLVPPQTETRPEPVEVYSSSGRQNVVQTVNISNNAVPDVADNSSRTSSTSVSPLSSVPSSPRPEPTSFNQTIANMRAPDIPVAPLYALPTDSDRCVICDKKVYAMEKRGPIKDVLFHKGCFRCGACGMILTLKNFCQNPNDLDDLNVYCQSHKPIEKVGKLDGRSLSINRALTVPKLDKVNEQIRGGPEIAKGGKLGADAIGIKSAMNVPATDLQVSNKQKQKVWTRSERQSERVPPQDVVKHDLRLKGYGGEDDPDPDTGFWRN